MTVSNPETALASCLVEGCESNPAVEYHCGAHYVECKTCGDQGPIHWLEQDAVSGWNKRHRLNATPSRQDGLREALGRIEATLAAAERIMTASPFWDDNARYAGKALLDYPRSQIAAERAALSDTPPPDNEETEALREACDMIEDLIDRMDYVGTGSGKTARAEEKEDRAVLTKLRAALSAFNNGGK